MHLGNFSKIGSFLFDLVLQFHRRIFGCRHDSMQVESQKLVRVTSKILRNSITSNVVDQLLAQQFMFNR